MIATRSAGDAVKARRSTVLDRETQTVFGALNNGATVFRVAARARFESRNLWAASKNLPTPRFQLEAVRWVAARVRGLGSRYPAG